MLKKIGLVIVVLSLITTVSSEIRSGSVTMPAASSGYQITNDALTAPATESAPADVLIQQDVCTLSCPGACYYRITGCKIIYQLQIPVDSVDFSVPIDTLNAALVRPVDQGMQIGAMNSEEFDRHAFIIQDCEGNFALFRIVAVEEIPTPFHPLPGDCYSTGLISVTMNWVYQDDDGLLFDKPTANDKGNARYKPADARRSNRAVYVSPFHFTPGKAPVAVYDIQGRLRGFSRYKASPGLMIVERGNFTQHVGKCR